MTLLDQIIDESHASGYPITAFNIPGYQTALLCCLALPMRILGMIDTYNRLQRASYAERVERGLYYC